MKKKKKIWKIILIILAVIIIVPGIICTIFCTYGGFGTGPCADVDEFAKYASGIEDIKIPEGTRVVALGEATHGNKEYQKLKLDVFKVLVENYGVRAFVLEGDFGGCESANRYIQGGEGTAEEAAAGIGFRLYCTDEMAELIEWMREYNKNADESDKIIFCGMDMQRYEKNYEFLISDAKKLGLDASEVEKLFDGEEVRPEYTKDERRAAIESLKAELETIDDPLTDYAVHHADVLIQNMELGDVYAQGGNDGAALRDKLMYENTMWVLRQEEKRGNECIFLSAHNGHVEQNGTYPYSLDSKVTGNLLATELGEAYYSIGTDFYKTIVNLPRMSGKRTNKKFYSYDPLAKAAKKNKLDICYLDFATIPDDSSLKASVNDYTYMGSLGENYSILHEFLPYAYRVWRSPSETYDSIIIVTKPTPTVIKE